MCVSAGIPPRETRFLRARFALRLLSSTYFTHHRRAVPALLSAVFAGLSWRNKAVRGPMETIESAAGPSVRPSSGSPVCQSAAGGPVPATVACAMSGNFEVTWAIKGSTLRGTRESEPNCLFQNERIFPLCFQAESDRGERGRRRLERPAFAVCSLDGAAGNVDKKCSLLSEGGRADSVQSERETIGARTDDGSSILLGQSDLRRRAKKGRRTLSLSTQL